VGHSGTVKTVYAKPETTLSRGASLFALTDTEYAGNLESLSAKHREYAELLQKLFAMYETEVLTAPCSGTVSGVDDKSPYLLSAQGQDWQILLLHGGDAPCTGTEKCKADEHLEGCYYFCTGDAECHAKLGSHLTGCYRDCSDLASCTARPGQHKLTCLTWCESAGTADTCRALMHKADCIESCESAQTAGTCSATGKHKTGCIESCISSNGSVD
jgi:hypothetical protein